MITFSWSRFVFHAVFGMLMICSNIIHLPPNLFDNLKMMECTVPNAYFASHRDQVSGRVSVNVTLWSFLSVELGVLVDDVFAFVTHVPAPYRIAVFACHACFLLQMYALPWAKPVNLVNARAVRLHDRLATLVRTRSVSSSNVAPSAAEQYAANVTNLLALVGGANPDDVITNCDEKVVSTPAVHAQPERAERNESLIAGEAVLAEQLDAEPVSWVDLETAAAQCPTGAPQRGTRAHALRLFVATKGSTARSTRARDEILRKEFLVNGARLPKEFAKAVELTAAVRGVIGGDGAVGFVVLALCAVALCGMLDAAPKLIGVQLAKYGDPSTSRVTRSPYEVNAAVKGGGVALPSSLVGARQAKQASTNVQAAFAGASGWTIVQENGDAAVKALSSSAAGGGTSRLRKNTRPKSAQGARRHDHR
jgi:hypothetical protein